MKKIVSLFPGIIFFLSLLSCNPDHQLEKSLDGTWLVVTSTDPEYDNLISAEFEFLDCPNSEPSCAGLKTVIEVNSSGDTTTTARPFDWVINEEVLQIIYFDDIEEHYVIESLNSSTMLLKDFFSDYTYNLERID